MPGVNYAYWIKKYDSNNNIIERQFFDINNKSIQVDNYGTVGYKIKYDILRRPTVLYSINKANKIISTSTIEYLEENNCKLTQSNVHGNVTDFATFDKKIDWIGEVYLFESSKFGQFKIRTTEFDKQDNN